jgi:hypothetical protein
MEEEKSVPEVKKSAISINTELLKEKLEALKAKNAELMSKVKVQGEKLKAQALQLSERAGNSKAGLAGRSVWGKMKDWFNKTKVLPVKQVVGYHISDEETGWLYGYVFHSRATGTIVIREAYICDYDLGNGHLFLVRPVSGHPTLCRENVSIMIDAPEPANIPVE